MPLHVGSRVGAYEVTALLGRGGMGEVWRARHLSLKRDDALKVLPDAFAGNVQRLARFQREAEVLASLNHPNVAHVHGLEEADGSRVLVMELVEGETLADLIDRGPIPIGRALDIAKQIAQGLEAAHERSIVHRDLKPANIKVRSDGLVKVLDFGLAKAFDSGSSGDFADVATVTESVATLTRQGVAVGTIGYMSPEQMRGEAVDARTDVWAFGCVLYEMLTGRRPFSGASAPDVVAAVLTSAPDWSALPADVPAAVRALLRRCLARDARQRPKHLSSVMLVVDDEALSGTGSAAAPARPSHARAIWWSAIAAAAALLVAAGLGAWWWMRPARDLRVLRTEILADTQMSPTDRCFAFTADGRSIVYAGGGSSQIVVRHLDALEEDVILKSPGYIRGPFTSPDGEWVGYVESAFFLKKIPIAGGPVAPIVEMDGPSRGASWGPDGTIVFGTGASATGIQQVSSAGGAVTVLTRPRREQGEGDHVQPVWLPDGRHVLFTIATFGGNPDASKIAVLDVATRTWHTVVDGGFAARYVEGGYLVYMASGALWGIRFDASRLQTQGAPFKLSPMASAGGAVAVYDITADGTLAYTRNVPSEADERSLVWVDRHGRETTIAVPLANYRHPRLSPDGGRLALAANGTLVVWEMDRPWSTATRLPSPPAQNWYPVWTPDGRRIVFGSWRGGGFSNLYVQEPGSPEAERLTDSPDMQLPTSITPDGRTVIFHSFTKNLSALQLDAQGAARQRVLVETPREERNGVLSADGHWLAYEAESAVQPGQLDVYVRPFPNVNTGLWQVTTAGGIYPAWRRDGRELFYYRPDGTMVATPVEASGLTWQSGEPKDLFRGPYLYQGDGSLGREYDVAPDGQRFIMVKNVRTASASTPPHFVLVQNWTAELAKAAASK